MGRDKAIVEYEGEPLWQRQLQLLRKISPLEILISARSDPAWRPFDTRFIPDAPPSRGPLSGLAAAMSVMRGTHLLALAVDMPLMTDTYLLNLWKCAEPGKGLLPGTDSRMEPLAAIYPRESFPHIGSALQTLTDFSVKNVAEKLVTAGCMRVIQVAKEHETFFRNLNSPADVTLNNVYD